MRVFKTMFAALLAALMLVSLPGCKKEKEFVVPSNMTREEAALFTAIANVCPKDDNHSKVEYLTFFIEGWSFDKLPPEITSYLTEYCANSGANLVQLSYEDLVAQGYITKGDGDFYKTYENDQTRLRLAMKIGWTLNVVIMEAELTSVQRISCLQRAAAERLSKKKLLEIILNDAFAEKPIDEPDEICYNITNTSEDGADQAQFESPLRCVAKRKRGVVRCGRRKISSLVSYCCSLVSDFLSTVYHFPYLQAWLGSS